MIIVYIYIGFVIAACVIFVIGSFMEKKTTKEEIDEAFTVAAEAIRLGRSTIEKESAEISERYDLSLPFVVHHFNTLMNGRQFVGTKCGHV